jgi:hypothetical protein
MPEYFRSAKRPNFTRLLIVFESPCVKIGKNLIRATFPFRYVFHLFTGAPCICKDFACHLRAEHHFFLQNFLRVIAAVTNDAYKHHAELCPETLNPIVFSESRNFIFSPFYVIVSLPPREVDDIMLSIQYV